MPGAVPIMSYPVAHGGTMVSHPSAGDASAHASHAVDFAHAVDDDDGVPTTPDSQFDVTERVQARRHASPTNFVRAAPRRKGPIVVVVSCAVAAAGIALFIVFGGSSPAVSAVPAVQPDPATVAAPAPLVPPPVVPTPAAEPPAAVGNAAEPPPSAPTEAAVAPSTPTLDEPKPKPAAHPVAVHKPAPAPARPRPHPVAKPKPEDKPAWNADSPFMPVRTDKH
jgi:hypothetical protein